MVSRRPEADAAPPEAVAVAENELTARMPPASGPSLHRTTWAFRGHTLSQEESGYSAIRDLGDLRERPRSHNFYDGILL